MLTGCGTSLHTCWHCIRRKSSFLSTDGAHNSRRSEGSVWHQNKLSICAKQQRSPLMRCFANGRVFTNYVTNFRFGVFYVHGSPIFSPMLSWFYPDTSTKRKKRMREWNTASNYLTSLSCDRPTFSQNSLLPWGGGFPTMIPDFWECPSKNGHALARHSQEWVS